jgi:hypothetical protein
VIGLDVPTIETLELRARAGFDSGAVAVTFAGVADGRAADDIAALLGRLHDEALRLAVPEVTVDLRELDFMSASCVKALAAWLSDVRELPAQTRYSFRFLSAADKTWQPASLDALRRLASDLVRIET